MVLKKLARTAKSTQTAPGCASCTVRDICLPGPLTSDEVAEFGAIVKRTKVLHKGDYLYRAGEPFTGLYAVFSGLFKAFHMDRNGSEQITSFYFPGEILGLHAIDTRTYQYDAMALNTSVACGIGYESYKRLATKMPGLDERLHNIFSRELIKARFAAANLTATQKVATLLMSLSRRLQERGYSPFEYALPMSNMDIASRLRLVNETVSRVFGQLARDGIVNVDERRVRILDIKRLAELCPRNLHIMDERDMSQPPTGRIYTNP